MKRLILALFIAVLAVGATAQTCPKVSYTTNETTTLRNVIKTVNCLVGEKASKPAAAEAAAPAATTGTQVEALPIIGPQHTHAYHKIIVAILSVNTGNATSAAVATPDSPNATVSATAGAECKMKINKDNTVDAQCNLTGGTLYVVYHN